MHKGIVEEIQNHFADRGWHPLLPLNITMLHMLDVIGCAGIVAAVKECTEREQAMTLILEAVRQSDERRTPHPPPAKVEDSLF